MKCDERTNVIEINSITFFVILITNFEIRFFFSGTHYSITCNVQFV